MSSLRNAAHRRNHRERSQPLKRQNLGLLEKHKDYVLRAKDYHNKQDRLKLLRDKARNRNQDEFYFKMINTKTKEGVHISERKNLLDHDTLKLLRTQDLAYLISQRTMEAKRIEKLRAEITFINDSVNEAPASDEDSAFDEDSASLLHLGKNTSKHTIFVDDENEVQNFDPVAHFNTVPELLSQKHNRLTINTLSSTKIKTLSLTEEEKNDILRQRKLLYKELKERLDRLAKIDKATRETEIQKALMGKGKREKIGKDSNGLPVFKWAEERKR